MEPIIYRNNPLKAIKLIGYSIIAYFAMSIEIFALYFLDMSHEAYGPIFIIVCFVTGTGLIFKGLFGLVNRKKQLVLTNESIYVGFNYNKTIPWKNVELINLTEDYDEVSQRRIWMLKIRSFKRMKSGHIIYKPFNINVELLKLNRENLLTEINQFRQNKDVQTN